MQHSGPIAGIAVHGKHVATAGYDNQLILWDAGRHEAVARANHDHLVNQCAFSNTGALLVSASSDFSARIWEVPSLRLKAVLSDHSDDVDMAVFSPDDRLIATCALDRCVRVFTAEGRCLQVMRGHTGNVLSLAWTADSRRVVSSSVDGTVREWDALTGALLHVADLAVRSDSVAVDAQGHTWAGDDRGRIACITGGTAVFTQAHRAGIKKIVLDLKQRMLVSLSYDRAVAVWRIGNDGRLREMKRSTCPAPIWARAAAVLDGNRIAIGTFGKSYAVFDWKSGAWDLNGVAAGRAVNAVLALERGVYTVGDAGLVEVDGRPHTETGSLCNFLAAAGDSIYCGGQLGQIYDADDGTILYEHHSPLNCAVAFERRAERHLAVGTYTGEVLVFRVLPGGPLDPAGVLAVYENAVKGLAADATTLFSVCASTDVAWHRIDDLSLLRLRRQGHDRIANACCAAGAGIFASVGRDRMLRTWDGHAEQSYPSPHPNSVKCIAADGEQAVVMTGSYGGTLAAFDLRTRQWGALQRPTAAGISSITWDPRCRSFLAASYDGRIYPVQP